MDKLKQAMSMQRGTGRPFQKGRKKVGGRKRGTPNRSTTEVKMWAEACFSNPRWRRAIMKLMVAGKAPATVQYILMLLGGRPKNVVEVQSDTQPSVGDQFAEQLLEGMTPDQIASVADDARKRLLERATGVAIVQDDGPPV
jgi:hypothetical protein